VDAVLRVDVDEEADMVGHDLQLNDLRALLRRGLVENMLWPHTHVPDEDRAAVLGAPHDVVGAEMDDVVGRLG
jgi:hypothetical protein